MKRNRLKLLTRLAHVREEQAGREVQQWREALEQSKQQADMLYEYRRQLSTGNLTGHTIEGRTIHAFAEFAGVAEKAQQQANESVEQTQAELDKALQAWYAKRQKYRVLTDKKAEYDKQFQRDQRNIEDRISKEAENANRQGND